jgi:branched-chain amino acid transport system ATP-binding protein
MTDDSLRTIDVSVEFSGLRALDGVSLSVAPGEILGLIGTKGTVKTTLVNAITGQVPLASGRVLRGSEDITRFSPRQVALAGIARSFQVVRLFNNLTVAENVEAAALVHTRDRRTAREKTATLLAELGLAARADDLAVGLSYGDKRRVEIARGLAADPAFLLLDEPAAGMNEAETGALLSILEALPRTRGLSLLIIDHDMGLIMRLCERLHVLASGRTIAEGDKDSVRANPAVIEAYLGTGAEGSAHA